MGSNEDRPKKKCYQSPKLIVYGDIRELTLNAGVSGKNDTGGTGKTKTG